MLKRTGRNIQEVAWFDAPGQRAGRGGATGGGVSTYFARPTWQAVRIASLNAGNIDGRVVPDVAALAGKPLYDMDFLGHVQPNSGTSASAPLWAALIARINAVLPATKRQRFLTPLLYRKTTSGEFVGQVSLIDITKGNNASSPSPGIGYSAGKGFDAVTGWGVPDGMKLLTALKEL